MLCQQSGSYIYICDMCVLHGKEITVEPFLLVFFRIISGRRLTCLLPTT